VWLCSGISREGYDSGMALFKRGALQEALVVTDEVSGCCYGMLPVFMCVLLCSGIPRKFVVRLEEMAVWRGGIVSSVCRARAIHSRRSQLMASYALHPPCAVAC
jgi:hypothetical protein